METATVPPNDTPLADDLALIKGADAIARALNITTQQFYKSHHLGGLKFVWKEPGIGIVTTRAAAARYLRERAAGNPIGSGPSHGVDKVA